MTFFFFFFFSRHFLFFLDGTISDRKQLVEITAMHRQPVQLSESGCGVITFLSVSPGP